MRSGASLSDLVLDWSRAPDPKPRVLDDEALDRLREFLRESGEASLVEIARSRCLRTPNWRIGRRRDGAVSGADRALASKYIRLLWESGEVECLPRSPRAGGFLFRLTDLR